MLVSDDGTSGVDVDDVGIRRDERDRDCVCDACKACVADQLVPLLVQSSEGLRECLVEIVLLRIQRHKTRREECRTLSIEEACEWD